MFPTFIYIIETFKWHLKSDKMLCISWEYYSLLNRGELLANNGYLVSCELKSLESPA